MKKAIIVAISRNNVIGNDGVMPWHSKEDFKHFKETTMGFPLIMGRKTFYSLGGKPLKGRLNIILTKQNDFSIDAEGVKVLSSPEEAYDYCERENYEKCFVIGGGEIYKSEINKMDELIISEMKVEVEGDTYFPEIDKSIWKVDDVEERNDFTLKIYRKKN